MTQVFRFQEVNAIALATFERFGLKFHDQVVYMQMHQAARRVGARVLSGTIPEAYGEMGQPWRRVSPALARTNVATENTEKEALSVVESVR